MTDTRDTRHVSNPDHRIEDMDSLAREIDELARQRERIFQALRPAGRSSQDNLTERTEKLENENRLLKERLAGLSEPNTGPLADKLRKTEQLLEERSLELQQLRKQGSSDAALLEEVKKQNGEIERLKSQLTDGHREQPDMASLREELHRLKINLADSIIEQKQVGSTNQDLLKQIFELRQEVFQHQSQVRDLSLRLDLSKRNEQALSEQEKQQEIELVKLRACADEVNDAKTKLMQQLKSLSAEHEKSLDELEKAHGTISELQAMHARLKSEFESEKIQRQAAETREHEIVLAFDSINQERQVLKEKVSRLLIGVKDYITPPSRPLSATEDGILEPREMRPYIPFCFPDNLPSQLRPIWKRTKRLPLVHPPGSLTTIQSESFNKTIRKPLTQTYRFRELPCPPASSLPTQPFRQPLPKDFKIRDVLDELRMPTSRASRSFPEAGLTASIERRFPPRFPIPKMAGNLSIPPVLPKIFTTSVTLFYDYLANDIVTSFRNLMYRLEYRYPPDSPRKSQKFDHETQMIYSGRVALHTTSNLQFALRYPVRSDLSPRFPHDRLKYLLRTIGDSLTSMMARLDNKEPDDESGS